MYPPHMIDETRKAFENIDESPLKNLEVISMKNDDGRFGIITMFQIIINNFSIIDQHTSKAENNNWYIYNTLDEMLEAGWIVD